MKHADAKTVSKWLRSKEQPKTNANVVRDGQVAQNSAQAAQFMYDHWCEVWNGPGGPADEDIATQLASTFPTAENPQPLLTWPLSQKPCLMPEGLLSATDGHL